MYKNLFLSLALVLAFPSAIFAAPEQWVRVSSDHFTLITDTNEKQGRHIVDQFERMRWMFQTLFPKAKVDPAAPIFIIAAKNAKSFQAIEPAAYLSEGQLQLGGYFLKATDKNYIILRLDVQQEHPFESVYHEYTHLQFGDDFDWLPLWLNEGLAEFFQNTDIHDKNVMLGQPSVNDILFLRENQLIPLATLFKVDSSSPYYHEDQKGTIFYAESWAMTHYLQVTDRQRNTHKLDSYLNLVRNHEDAVVAAERAFGDLKQLQNALSSYIKAGDYKAFILNSAAAPIDEASYKVKILTQPEADAERADCLAYIGRKDDAKALVNSVLAADPNNTLARETLGYLAFRDGDNEAARKWYGEAVKLDSQSYLAHYYFAATSMSGSGPEQNTQIESSLRAAIRLDPAFAPSYDLLAVLLAQHREKLDEAHTLSLHAIQLDRGNLSFRVNAANVLMAMGRYDDAAATLRIATRLAKNPADTAMLQSRIDQVEQIARSNKEQAALVVSSATDSVQTQTVEKLVVVDEKPKHPTESASGPKHQTLGIIRHVECSYPSVMDFKVETSKKTYSLYSNNYFKLDLSALGFEPKGGMNMCKDLEGFEARVQYTDSADKSVDGQAIAIELRK